MAGVESPLDAPSLPERLLLAMKRAGLSQTDLAARLHTDSRVLRRYLSGERIPPPEMTAAWERVCGLAPGELSGGLVSQPPPGPARPVPEMPPPRRWNRWMMASAGLVVVATVGVAAWRLGASSNPADDRAARPGAEPCPSRPKGSLFEGRTFEEGVVVRGGAGQDFPSVARIAGNCDVGFRGYCLGQPIADVFVGTLDSRWFVVSSEGSLDSGVVASGVVNGNPPVGTSPMACPGSRDTPPHVELRVSSAADPVGGASLHASAPGADIVGFAAFTSIAGATSPSPLWQQLGFSQAGPDFSIQLNQPGDPPLGAGDVTVIAVVCLAAEAPTSTEATSVIRILADGTVTQPDAAIASDAGPEAGQAACRYPTHPDERGAFDHRIMTSPKPSCIGAGQTGSASSPSGRTSLSS